MLAVPKQLEPVWKAQVIQKGKKGFSDNQIKPADVSGAQGIAAEQAHKHSQFVLNEQKTPWPSVATMKKVGRSDWTIPSIKARIAELKRDHRQQLAKAIKYQIFEEDQMKLDEYWSLDDSINSSPDITDVLKSLYRMDRHLQVHQSDDFISRLRHTHILTLKPLYEKLQKLLRAEEKAKEQRARQFPKSSQAWRQMDTRDAKLKVAKFLLLDKKKQDEMVEREMNWRGSKMDIDTVVLEFKSNIMFSHEVNNFVKENQTTDPRRRPT